MKQAITAFARRNGVQVLVLAIVIIPLIPFWRQIVALGADFQVHAPDWALWTSAGILLQLHILAALTALAIGTVIMLRPKGRGLHKALGWSWVVAMATTAISSLFMTGLNGDFYSLIHLLSGWTLIALPMAIYAIRSHKVEAHRRAMTGMFIGGLLFAGALTFIPGRFMYALFFG